MAQGGLTPFQEGMERKVTKMKSIKKIAVELEKLGKELEQAPGSVRVMNRIVSQIRRKVEELSEAVENTRVG